MSFLSEGGRARFLLISIEEGGRMDVFTDLRYILMGVGEDRIYTFQITYVCLCVCACMKGLDCG